MKKPPCPVCRSTRYRKDASGAYVCQYGHQLTGYQEEVADEEAVFAAGAYGHRTRRERGGAKERKRRGQPRKLRFPGSMTVMHYRRGEAAGCACLLSSSLPLATSAFETPPSIIFEAFQGTLKIMVKAMIERMGLPEELEFAVLDLWLIFVTASPVTFDDRNPESVEWMPTSSQVSAWTTDDDSDALDTDVTRGNEDDDDEDDDDEDEGSDDFGAGADAEEGERGRRTRARSRSQSQSRARSQSRAQSQARARSASVASSAARERAKERIRERRLLARAPLHHPRPWLAIVLCYLGCVLLRLPVMMADIQRWAASGRIPYYHRVGDDPAEELRSTFNVLQSGLENKVTPDSSPCLPQFHLMGCSFSNPPATDYFRNTRSSRGARDS
ncbi:hypothetical protein BDK51DRAFT_49059 [Blyttiomyces helicus]|uniref:Uncharacterized protein n=1 Tax=Blyttiomyces helicus TaxID=388810 RepID=A0A4P9VZL4_9FUNG|nr:hypothetical protein BDK51DRAFT_49059 [Blyttiomyces helicus]|eukprot:RKO84455.1 hypothetical protein BDK51DRAFT_49059 [Blyttiomyces helicus]